jgi:hypothetical protein
MKIVRYSHNGQSPRLGCFLGEDRVMDLRRLKRAHFLQAGRGSEAEKSGRAELPILPKWNNTTRSR